MKLKMRLALLASIAVANTAVSQSITSTSAAHLLPYVHRDADGSDGCGIRTVVFVPKNSGSDAYDFGLYIDAPSHQGLINVGKIHRTAEQIATKSFSTDAVTPMPQSFWIKETNQGQPVYLAEPIEGLSPGYAVGAADVTRIYEIVQSIVLGDKMQFAMHYLDEPEERIVKFSTNLSFAQLVPLQACFTEVLYRIAKDTQPDTR